MSFIALAAYLVPLIGDPSSSIRIAHTQHMLSKLYGQTSQGKTDKFTSALAKKPLSICCSTFPWSILRLLYGGWAETICLAFGTARDSACFPDCVLSCRLLARWVRRDSHHSVCDCKGFHSQVFDWILHTPLIVLPTTYLLNCSSYTGLQEAWSLVMGIRGTVGRHPGRCASPSPGTNVRTHSDNHLHIMDTLEMPKLCEEKAAGANKPHR